MGWETVGVSSYYHLGFVVDDLDQAVADATRALGVAFSPVRDGRLGDWDYRITFSTQGPPYFELIQGPPGSPWDATNGPRLDHLGYWVHDITEAKAHLVGQGVPVDFDACPYGRPFTYHRLSSLGVRIELVDTSVQQVFLDTWGSCGAPQPTRGHIPSPPGGQEPV